MAPRHAVQVARHGRSTGAAAAPSFAKVAVDAARDRRHALRQNPATLLRAG